MYIFEEQKIMEKEKRQGGSHNTAGLEIWWNMISTAEVAQ